MLPWQECSERLIETGELDPVYNLVAYGRDHLGQGWAERFCMAHLMFYNVETSLTLADVADEHFWFRTLQMYDTAKRGQERRHYRGQGGLKSIDSMREMAPGEVFRVPTTASVPSLKTVYRNLQQASIQGFGTYFLLKWADLLDVVFKIGMDYSPLVHNSGYLFEGAAKGLESIWPNRPHHEGLLEINSYIRKWRDPFQGYRMCGLSEAETIACAYRTYYVKKHYTFGWDINNLHETLKRHPSKNASLLLKGLPKQTEEWL